MKISKDFMSYSMSDGDFDLDDLLSESFETFDSTVSYMPKIESLADFEDVLLKRSPPEKAYGIFSADVTMCRFLTQRGTKVSLLTLSKRTLNKAWEI
ncbi:MAG: hypothetical protein LBH43_18300 [Treponema sp.]|jgi:hypothetical protein|nr:hypothetical protein [Treponema sp.]